MGVKKQLEEKGIALVAVGSGTPDQANTFVEQYGFTGEMYVSPDLSAYRAFKLVRGLWRSVGP
ncbi:MAG: peroxiredoxin-like family protein, partial [Desulfatiglandaceae bacterium]